VSPVTATAPFPPAPAASYLRRIGGLRDLVDEVAPASWSDPRWWALVSAVAAVETRTGPAAYLLSDAGPATDTFMAWHAPAPADPVREAIALARAARAAIADLDGALVDQPLAGTIALDDRGARLAPVPLDQVAFAVGDRVTVAPLAASDAELYAALRGLASGGPIAAPLVPLTRGRPCCTVSIGEDAWATARHGHRRAWTARSGSPGAVGGPWLGLARIGDHLIASTCHYAVDGFGHALLCREVARELRGPDTPGPVTATAHALPPLAAVAGAVPLALAARAWRAPPPTIELAYRLGVILGDEVGVRRGMSPTIQIPVAPGHRDDPERWRRRVLPAVVSVRWLEDRPEPALTFTHRARAAIAREALGAGLASRVNAAGRALPVPVRWKRLAASPGVASPWIAPLFDVLAGRTCVSSIRPPAGSEELPALIAASSPARTDAIGATVVTVVGGVAGATITVTGTGRWGTDAACGQLIDRLVADATG